MATASDTFTWTDTKVELREYLGIADTTADDAVLELLLAAAAADCDFYCRWYYVDEDGETVDETPADPSAEPLIKLGIFEWCKAALAMHKSAASGGVKVVKTGQLQESYQGDAKGVNLPELARKTAHDLWQQAVALPLLIGKGYR